MMSVYNVQSWPVLAWGREVLCLLACSEGDDGEMVTKPLVRWALEECIPVYVRDRALGMPDRA